MAERTSVAGLSRRVIDLRGQRFGLLVALGISDQGGNGRSAQWACACDCGGHRVVRASDLRSGKVAHCGCDRKRPGPKRRDSLPPGMLACEVATASYPDGRTGRDVGYQAHRRARQEPCEPCRVAHLTKCQARWADLTPEQQEQRRVGNRTEVARYRAKNPAGARRAKHKFITASRQIIRAAKAVPCADCGVTYPYYVMQFDHLGDKHFNIGVIGPTSRRRLRAEIAKCHVVCANCHAERTHKRTRRAQHTDRRNSEPIPANGVRVQADAAAGGAA